MARIENPSAKLRVGGDMRRRGGGHRAFAVTEQEFGEREGGGGAD